MSSPSRGATALVHDATASSLRPLALVLASRGVNLVVTAADERALGELVGEIVFGGGKGRHVAGPLGPATLARAWDKATESFSTPTFLIASENDAAVVDFAATRALTLLRIPASVSDVPSAVAFLDRTA